MIMPARGIMRQKAGEGGRKEGGGGGGEGGGDLLTNWARQINWDELPLQPQQEQNCQPASNKTRETKLTEWRNRMRDRADREKKQNDRQS